MPMPTSETWIPVLPSVTLSVGLLGRADRSRPAPAAAEAVVVPAASATVAVAVACAMKSRRFRGGVITSVSPVPKVPGLASFRPGRPGRPHETKSDRIDSNRVPSRGSHGDAGRHTLRF